MSNEKNETYTRQVESHGGSGKIKPDDVNYDHAGNPRKAAPFSIIDHKQIYTNKVDKRAFYDVEGLVYLEIHTTNHGNTKNHPFKNNGEHTHDIKWQGGKPLNEIARELTETERKDNGDIL